MPSSFVKMASGRLIKIIGKCRNKFQLDKFEFHNEFLVLPAMNSMILGNPFFKKHDIDVCPTRNLLKLPQMTFHMNNIKVEKKRKILQTPKIDIFRRKKKTKLQPKQQEINIFKIETDKQYNGISSAVIPDSKLENNFDSALASALKLLQTLVHAQVPSQKKYVA